MQYCMLILTTALAHINDIMFASSLAFSDNAAWTGGVTHVLTTVAPAFGKRALADYWWNHSSAGSLGAEMLLLQLLLMFSVAVVIRNTAGDSTDIQERLYHAEKADTTMWDAAVLAAPTWPKYDIYASIMCIKFSFRKCHPSHTSDAMLLCIHNEWRITQSERFRFLHFCIYRTKIECAAACLQTAGCNAFSFDGVNNNSDCKIGDATVVVEDADAGIPVYVEVGTALATRGEHKQSYNNQSQFR